MVPVARHHEDMENDTWRSWKVTEKSWKIFGEKCGNPKGGCVVVW